LSGEPVTNRPTDEMLVMALAFGVVLAFVVALVEPNCCV
jgi:hypothetical protein